MSISNNQILSSLFSTEELDRIKNCILPAIQIDFSDGLWLIAGGSVQIKLQRRLTDEEFNEVRRLWKERPRRAVKEEVKFKEFLITSASSGNSYKVTLDNYAWKCGCQGFGWRGKCKHIEEAKLKLKEHSVNN